MEESNSTLIKTLDNEDSQREYNKLIKTKRSTKKIGILGNSYFI